jgi:hypothetical protein
MKRWSVTDTETTTDTLDRVWDMVNRRRSDSKQVPVRVDDLLALLNDHRRFCDVVKTN